MTNSVTSTFTGSNVRVTSYTVVCKSGQRGVEFSDPALAAQAFGRADEQDRPFVLRHRGNHSVVIAGTRRGRKVLSFDDMHEDTFSAAFHSLHTYESVPNK